MEAKPATMSSLERAKQALLDSELEYECLACLWDEVDDEVEALAALRDSIGSMLDALEDDQDDLWCDVAYEAEREAAK